MRCHHATKNDALFKTLIIYFWGFSLNIFGPWLTEGNLQWKTKSQTRGHRGTEQHGKSR